MELRIYFLVYYYYKFH